jgi:tetratricopeptide (TPR) repeat protein
VAQSAEKADVVLGGYEIQVSESLRTLVDLVMLKVKKHEVSMPKVPKVSPFKGKKKQVITAAVVVLLLISAAGAGLLVRWLTTNGSTGSQGDTVGSTPGLPTVVGEAQDQANNGQMDKSNQTLKDSLSQPNPTNDDKYNAYWQLGVNASNSNQPKQAIDYFKQAEAIKSTYTISHLIAEQCEIIGDKTTAILYYKKAIGQLNTSSPVYVSDKEYLESKVTFLGGSL